MSPARLPQPLCVLIAAALAAAALAADPAAGQEPSGGERARGGEPAAAAGKQRPLADYPWQRRVRRAARFARRRAGSVSFAVVDERGRIHGFHRGTRYSSASLVKAMLLVAYLSQGGVRRRHLHASDRRLLGPMIRVSDNDAASAIYSQVGSRRRCAGSRAGPRMRRFIANPGLGRLPAHGPRPGPLLRPHRPPAAAPPPQVRARPAAADRLRPALGHPAGDPARLARPLQGRLVPRRRRLARPPGRAAPPRRAPASARRPHPGRPSLGYGADTIKGVTARLLRGYRYQPGERSKGGPEEIPSASSTHQISDGHCA